MLIRKIILENYGLYSGKVELDLVPRSSQAKEKPIILFGGKNGAGKTTFLEAMRLVLYGKNYTRRRVTKAEYEAYLKGKIHQGVKPILPIDFARIAIEFDYVTLGEQVTYYVERSWKLKKDSEGVEETLQININGTPEENVTEEYWKGFIEGIIPERLSQLFFFDGEKIKDIASDDEGNSVLADSIKTLLGLDVVDKLKADLTIYKNKKLKNNSFEEDKKRWTEIDKIIADLKAQIEHCLSEELPPLRTRFEGKLAEIRKRETDLHTEGNLFATRRDSLKTERNKLSTQIEQLEGQIRQECEGDFPFSLCPTMAAALQKQLNTENKLKRQAIIHDEIQSYTSDIIKTATSASGFEPNTVKKIEKFITELAKPRLELSSELKNTEIFLSINESTAHHIKATINNAQTTAKEKVNTVCTSLQDATKKLHKITIEMNKIPEDEQVKPIFEELAILNQERGALQQDEKQLLAKIEKLKVELKTKQKELDKIIERQQSEDRLVLLDKVNLVLDEYLTKLTISKTQQLKTSVAEAFNCLSRKGDLLERVEIDPVSFAVTLYDRHGNAIPKERLSSGEKQLYAVAMLWGLAKTSGRPLPVIIDTPLGRLDSDHRMNLITNYFPEASHQVILLSTDTEVDQKLFKELKPFVSHCYHLQYDPETQGTEATEEYFWAEN